MARPRCFVAMAFERADTEAIYQVMKTELLALDLEPRRIIDIEYNDDINVRILTEMRSSDLALVDLTYARPSVYFEAGFAQVSMDGRVVYTARTDHLSNTEDDRRVHFDLQMRNIVKWHSPADATFPTRLRRRLRQTVLPLIRDREEHDRNAAARKAFQQLAPNTRVAEALVTATHALAAAGYSSQWTGSLDRAQAFPHVNYWGERGVPHSLGWAHSTAARHNVELWAIADLNKARVTRYVDGHWARPLYNYRLGGKPAGLVVDHLILIGLNAPRHASLAAAMPAYSYNSEFDYFSRSDWLPVLVRAPRGYGVDAFATLGRTPGLTMRGPSGTLAGTVTDDRLEYRRGLDRPSAPVTYVERIVQVNVIGATGSRDDLERAVLRAAFIGPDDERPPVKAQRTIG